MNPRDEEKKTTLTKSTGAGASAILRSLSLAPTHVESKEYIEIPKIIHFIWAGGDRAMRARSIDVVQLWARENPLFDIWLWVDPGSASSPDVWRRINEKYTRKFGSSVKLKPISEIEYKGAEIENLKEYIHYEINRLRPNYGSSSDLLRYKILHQYGGAYFDSDVFPGTTSLENSKLFIKYPSHRLYVSKSQNYNVIGNDAFICTPDNPLMLNILRNAVDSFTLTPNRFLEDHNDPDWVQCSKEELTKYNSPGKMTYFYDDNTPKGYISKATPSKTGPAMIRRVLKIHSEEDIEDQNKLLESTASGLLGKMSHCVRAAEKNNRDWIGTKLPGSLPMERCLQVIRYTIQFEYAHFKMLRLDDHMQNLMMIVKCDENTAFDAIRPLLVNINLKKLTSLQLTFQYETTIAFCKSKRLFKKTYLFPAFPECEEIHKGPKYYCEAVDRVINPAHVDPLAARNRFLDAAIGFCSALQAKESSSSTETLQRIGDYLDDVQTIIKELIQNRGNSGAPPEEESKNDGSFQADDLPEIKEIVSLKEKIQAKLEAKSSKGNHCCTIS